MVRHAARLLPEKTTARRVVGGRAGAWVRQGRAYSRTSAIHRTESSAAGAPRHAPRGRRAVCIGTSPGIFALRWLGCLRPTGGAGGAQYSARPAPRQAAACTAAGAPAAPFDLRPGKEHVPPVSGDVPPAGSPERTLEKFARGSETGERGAGQGCRRTALTRQPSPGSLEARHPPPNAGRGDFGAGCLAVPSYPHDAVRRETRRSFGEAHSGEVRPRGCLRGLAEPAQETGGAVSAGLRSGPPQRTTASLSKDADEKDAPRDAASPPRTAAFRRRSREAPAERAWAARPRPGRRRWRSRCWCAAPRR